MKKLFTLLSIAVLSTAFGQEFNEIKSLKARGLNDVTVLPSLQRVNTQEHSLIQYSNGAVYDNALLSCNQEGMEVSNAWSRVYDLSNDYGITSEFTVTSVTVAGSAMSEENNGVEVAFSQFSGDYNYANITAGMGTGYAYHAFPLSSFEFADIELLEPQEPIAVGNKLAVAVISNIEVGPVYLEGGVMVGNNTLGSTHPTYLGWPGTLCISGGTITAPISLESYNVSYIFHVTGETALGTVELGSNKLAVYPNPATSEVNITLEGSKIASVEIADVTGRVVSSQAVKNGKVNVSNLSSGVYFLRVKDDKGVIRINKFIKK